MLNYILSQVAPAIGLSTDNPAAREWMIQQINKAAKELHESRDLVNCEREQLFALDSAVQQISLPYYVEQLRAIRRYNSKERLPLHDMRPRFKSDGWAENLLAWREKWKSPLKHSISTETPVTLTIPDVEAAPFTVVVSGSTPQSTRITESVIFAPGEVSKITANNFTDIVAFLNAAPHIYDVTMLDAEGDELSVLPNVADRAQYIVAQVLDPAITTAENPFMAEALYKIAFLYMRNDFDEFVCPGYDDAIVWQTLGNTLAKHRPKEAAAALGKVQMILHQRDVDKAQSKDKTISFEAEGTEYPFGHAYRGALYRHGLFPGLYQP